MQLKQAEQELESLDYIKKLEQNAEKKVVDLEKTIEEARAKHSQEIQLMKAEFLKEKKSTADHSHADFAKLSKEASRVAAECLTSHAERISVENQKLRTELLALLSESESLQNRKSTLQQQYTSLVRENEYLDDLKNMRVA